MVFEHHVAKPFEFIHRVFGHHVQDPLVIIVILSMEIESHMNSYGFEVSTYFLPTVCFTAHAILTHLAGLQALAVC